MNVLLTGASGVLGTHLIPHLKYRYALTLLRYRNKPSAMEGVRWASVDLRRPGPLNGLLENIDCVIHLAAVTHTDDVSRYFECNETGTRNLVAAAEINKIKHFIFLSTRAISAGAGHYAQSKLAAENIVVNSRLNWTIVRPSEVYGKNSKEMIGRLITLIKKFNFIPLPGDGSARIAPLFIEDVTGFIVRIILDNKAYKKTYTLTGPAEYTLAEFAECVASYLGKPHRVTKISVPLCVMRFLLEVNFRFRISDGLCRDQLPRLLIRKDFGFSAAAEDFDFHPIGIQEGLLLAQAK